MAHWAEINEHKEVIRVVVTDNNDANGDEGYQWLRDHLGGDWIQTSYNGNFRKQFAGIGYRYDTENDIFIAPQPFPSWVLNDSFDWIAPSPKPNGEKWYWDENRKDWINAETV
jgi:hypothetical protein